MLDRHVTWSPVSHTSSTSPTANASVTRAMTPSSKPAAASTTIATKSTRISADSCPERYSEAVMSTVSSTAMPILNSRVPKRSCGTRSVYATCHGKVKMSLGMAKLKCHPLLIAVNFGLAKTSTDFSKNDFLHG